LPVVPDITDMPVFDYISNEFLVLLSRCPVVHVENIDFGVREHLLYGPCLLGRIHAANFRAIGTALGSVTGTNAFEKGYRARFCAFSAAPFLEFGLEFQRGKHIWEYAVPVLPIYGNIHQIETGCQNGGIHGKVQVFPVFPV